MLFFSEQMRSWSLLGKKRPHSAVNTRFYSAIVRLNEYYMNQTDYKIAIHGQNTGVTQLN